MTITSAAPLTRETLLTRDVTLTDLLRAIQAQSDQLTSMLRMQNAMSDQVDELITKVDEINLPSGTGFSQDFES